MSNIETAIVASNSGQDINALIEAEQKGKNFALINHVINNNMKKNGVMLGQAPNYALLANEQKVAESVINPPANGLVRLIGEDTIFTKAIYSTGKVHSAITNSGAVSFFSYNTLSDSPYVEVTPSIRNLPKYTDVESRSVKVPAIYLVARTSEDFLSMDYRRLGTIDYIQEKIGVINRGFVQKIEDIILDGVFPLGVNQIDGSDVEPVTGLRNNPYIVDVTYSVSWDLPSSTVIEDLSKAVNAMPDALSEDLVLYVSRSVYRRLKFRDYKDASETSLYDKIVRNSGMVRDIVASPKLELDEMYLISHAKESAALAMGISAPLSVYNYTENVNQISLFYMKLTPYIQHNYDDNTHIVKLTKP